jgi:hypothetical protein
MSSSSHFDARDHRKRRSVATDADRAELERHYRFVPEPLSSSSSKEQGTWQDRMVQHYHQHLYKEYVLADLRFVSEKQLGLRWRTGTEVAHGKGSTSCGNKHCPSHQSEFSNDNEIKIHAAIEQCKPNSTAEIEERKRLVALKFGDDQVNFEVPFSYQEGTESKMELVKLRLCAKCAPLLFVPKNTVDPCLDARANILSSCHDKSLSKATTSVSSESACDKGSKKRKHKSEKRSKRSRRID